MLTCPKCKNNFEPEDIVGYKCGHFLCVKCFVICEDNMNNCRSCRPKDFTGYINQFIKWIYVKRIFSISKIFVVTCVMTLTIYAMVKISKDPGTIIECSEFVCEIERQIPFCDITLVENPDYKTKIVNEYCPPGILNGTLETVDVLCDFNQGGEKIIYPCRSERLKGYLFLCIIMLFCILYFTVGAFYIIEYFIMISRN